MRILFAGHSLAEPSGGGELSARALVTRLARRHHVEAVCIGRSARAYVLDERIRCRDYSLPLWPPPAGLPFHLAAMLVEARFRAAVVRGLQDYAPDLVILQQPAWLQPRDLPEAAKLVVFMRSLVCYGAGDANPSRMKRIISRPFREARFRRDRGLLDRADLIVSNSRFLQSALRRRAGVETQVVPPFIDVGPSNVSPASRPRECVTFVGLDEWKGASIALRLAAALPERRFLFLDGARASARLRAEADRLANVTRLGWTDDMGAVFDRTRVLLMPSLWEEPFGRLPVEAGARGIPTLASARGGLPESVGGGGILIDAADDLTQWIGGLQRMDDAQVYASLSDAARRHAATLTLDAAMQRFGDLVRRDLGLDLGTGL